MYKDISLTFVSGHVPEFIMNNEVTDMTKLKTKEQIEEFLRSKGFKKKDETIGCKDFVADCFYWKTKGECTKNKVYMEKNCPESCETCHKVEL